ncbi:hypothetical protein [Streptomyces sp. NPDC048659]|uniref:hypothetical protein n=1 Tax=Streptomyces sp. NPDC048659 TaxID=3155489 RepID=UPI0034196D16
MAVVVAMGAVVAAVRCPEGAGRDGRGLAREVLVEVLLDVLRRRRPRVLAPGRPVLARGRPALLGPRRRAPVLVAPAPVLVVARRRPAAAVVARGGGGGTRRHARHARR